MQNKGLIKTFAILFGLICVYYLSFTWVNNRIENDAKEFANGDVLKQEAYLDSVANVPVANYLYTNYTHSEIQDKAINLGLDLKGGINATLEVSVRDILMGLSDDSKNPVFNKALANATAAQTGSDKTYLDLFFEAFEAESKGSVKLSNPSIFGNKSLKDKVNFKMTDEEVKGVLQEEVKGSIGTAFEVLRNRIDRFGVTSPNIQRIGESGRVLIELPGARDIDRVKKLLTGTAKLQFWETYDNTETANFFIQANTKLAEILEAEVEEKTEEVTDTIASEDSQIDDLLGKVQDSVDTKAASPLFSVMFPSIPQNQNQRSSVIGSASVKDTATVNKYLAMPEVRALLPNNMVYAKFLWDAKPIDKTEVINLYAIKSNRQDIAPIEGDVVSDASQTFDQLGVNPEVSMTMNSKGTKLWAKMTEENVGKFVAVVLDDFVYSAPNVNGPIPNGRTSISGNFTIEEAQDLANALKSGKLPAAAKILESSVVGASLGHESIVHSAYSFLIALCIVLLWMVFYYGKAGIYADIALAINMLFIMGVLIAFGAVLTLPGVAGIIITIGMSVDANVIIYERIKEALDKGKVLKEAVKEGFSYEGAYSAIIDANITTFLTGIILYIFGSGPIRGFATTLMIGIATSLITAIFITRLMIDWSTERDRKMTFNTNITKGWFQNIRIDFLKKRKIAYILSGALLIVSIFSLATNGLNYGVDFTGGRTYTVRFDQPTNSTEVASSLKEVFGDAPEVKTYGDANQLKITTKYKVDENSIEVGDEVQELLFKGLQSYLPDGTTLDNFKISSTDTDQKIGLMKYFEVGPTIADDIKQAAIWAVLGSLIVVFIYILLRFRKWQFSLGAVVAVFHDVLIVLGIFSLFYKVLPFDMEIDQSFIAALLTVVGYSLNDTVIVFDRIREFTGKHHSWSFYKIVNRGLSTTLGRTINTSSTTLVVLLAIFIFGGDSIKGFMFAMIVGIGVGTYSSLFIASPIMYDTTKKLSEKK
ncbi:protein translocase subunit SecDF [Aureibaculum sp. 2210JD6-5]|uniref:protein translocase subunit SecDF n=1 Tax=Aureibaculum sp. 2210JD6-5 TaxID=3103957 RepID=UPI002AAE8C01|nr:protein translocase subunit SecDF [Aureibaculum sp. 2210JD6-5]MDY7395632.1 protein translocase subunit SecDF [Aureibaculum sp. 2210JD6-5]